jgi:hypothetical protein
MRIANWALARYLKGLSILWPAIEYDRNYLRDHIAGSADNNRIAYPYVLTADLILIVKCGIRYGNAADYDW